jgi:hypothetical protein
MPDTKIPDATIRSPPQPWQGLDPLQFTRKKAQPTALSPNLQEITTQKHRRNDTPPPKVEPRKNKLQMPVLFSVVKKHAVTHHVFTTKRSPTHHVFTA